METEGNGSQTEKRKVRFEAVQGVGKVVRVLEVSYLGVYLKPSDL